MRIRLIGTLQVSGAHGRMGAADFPSRKSAQVLAVLALAGGRPVAKERLVDQIWGDRLPEDPLGALEQAVSVLRRALRAVTEERVVLTSAGRYRLDGEHVAVDLDEVTRVLGPAGGIDRSGREQAMWEALTSIDGELLADQPGVPWVEHARERFRSDVERAWLDVARLAALRADHSRAAIAAERARTLALVAHDEAYEIEATALAGTGDHHRALALVAELERRVEGERRAARVDLDGLRARCAEPAVLTGAVRTTLTAPDGAVGAGDRLVLVGRDAALAAIERAWSGVPSGSSSVTVVEAPAGCGRSRLLAELAERSSGRRMITLACHAGEREQPLLVATRVLRAIGRLEGRARVARPPDSAADAFQRLAAAAERAGQVVVAIDDAHRADDGSLAALAALADPSSGVEVHLVLAVRAAFADAIATRFGDRAHRLRIGPLEPDDLAAIGAGDAWAETGGHPATLAACRAAAGRGGLLDASDLRAVLARVDELPTTSRTVVTAAAAGGTATTVRTLASRTGLTPEAVAAALEAGVCAGVVNVEGRRVRVIPDILRRALAARING